MISRRHLLANWTLRRLGKRCHQGNANAVGTCVGLGGLQRVA